MPINILMPALSPTMEEGKLAKWLKAEGDKIAPGDIIAEIETDKATMEYEAVEEGTLGRIVVPEGTDGVKVNDVIAILLEEGEDAADMEKAETTAPAKEKEAPKANGEDKAEEKKAKDQGAGEAGEAGETAPREAEAKGEEAKGETKREEAKGDAKSEPAEAKTPAPPAPKTAEGERIFASPLARRLAKEKGLDLTRIKGSGPHGRIVKADIEKAPKEAAAKAEAEAPRPAAAAAAPAGPGAETVKKMYEGRAFEEMALDGMRRTVAARLTEAKQTIPHFYLRRDIALDELLALRSQMNAKGEARGIKLSVNDYVIKACALALQQVPDCNAVWAGDRILKFEASDVAVAVAIEGGLFTPVIRDAEVKSLSAISAEMKDLAGRARERKLKPQEYLGGSFAVSNLGMYGIESFDAVINPPHGSILAVGAGVQKPVVRDGAVAVATVMTVTLSVDHRVIDGALGAQFLEAVKGYLEDPLSMLM
ncbi:MAG TPA: pyruvate dehydrogenase complex dihydrolipoamide acetyltransferase [Thermohalobaculum sp.]|nr:pyruvate dehydrogenase complex dihydrolipoamide acetyltransferase [Thermohalobaculum sp.]